MPANTSILAGDGELTLDMVHQYAYCPRRYHLMYVEGRWADNAYTVEGRHVHRRVDKLDHVLPEADSVGDSDQASDRSQQPDHKNSRDGDEPPIVSRSVPLSSERLGINAKLDLVSSDGQEAVPVDTKRGKVPNNPERCWEPERVQLMVQGLLLREAGYHCDHGVLYFAGSRTRVDVPFTTELEARTSQLIRDTHLAAKQTVIPPPLEDSPKCNGCSLAGICMPDETLALMHTRSAGTDDYDDDADGGDHQASLGAQHVRMSERATAESSPGLRRFYPARDHATPLYVQEQGTAVGKRSSRLVVRQQKDIIAEARLKDVSQVVLCGNVQISTQTVHLLCEAGVPVVYLSTGHWFSGLTVGQGLRNAYDRAAQFQAAADPNRCLAFARQLVADKAANQRSMLRRNARPQDRTLADMQDLIDRVPSAASLESLLGLEGNVASLYFQKFAHMLKGNSLDTNWDFHGRNRRPPRDPVNAMLSFGYAMLAKECTVALVAEGLDPWWGFYHQPRHGRPALALDVMEPLRPTIVDSAVITAINTGMVTNRHFTRTTHGCILQPAGRKAFIQAYEARLDQLVTHPVFDYRCAWRTVIRIQARLLARWLRGDVPAYTSVVTR